MRSAAACTADGCVEYTVQPGDTLDRIAVRFGTTPGAIAILNRMMNRTVFPGRVIRIRSLESPAAESLPPVPATAAAAMITTAAEAEAASTAAAAATATATTTAATLAPAALPSQQQQQQQPLLLRKMPQMATPVQLARSWPEPFSHAPIALPVLNEQADRGAVPAWSLGAAAHVAPVRSDAHLAQTMPGGGASAAHAPSAPMMPTATPVQPNPPALATVPETVMAQAAPTESTTPHTERSDVADAAAVQPKGAGVLVDRAPGSGVIVSLRLPARLVTSGYGMVSGVLTMTVHAVRFTPDPHDRCVSEMGDRRMYHIDFALDRIAVFTVDRMPGAEPEGDAAAESAPIGVGTMYGRDDDWALVAFAVSLLGQHQRQQQQPLLRRKYIFLLPRHAYAAHGQRGGRARTMLLLPDAECVPGGPCRTATVSESLAAWAPRLGDPRDRLHYDFVEEYDSEASEMCEAAEPRLLQPSSALSPDELTAVRVLPGAPRPHARPPLTAGRGAARRQLATTFPSRLRRVTWQLVYSTQQHGTSLKTLYRNAQELLPSSCPCVLLVVDTEHYVCGALLSEPPVVRDKCSGTGESMLFTVRPVFSVFPASGKNDYYIICQRNCIAVGSGDGVYGLWLDDMLYRGCSFPCATFDNACLASAPDFMCTLVELWALRDV